MINHGMHSTYCHGCRCIECTIAHTEYTIEWRKKRLARMTPDDSAHGTYYGYKCGCRCERCSKANTEYSKIRKNFNDGRRITDHGTISSYRAGCKCSACKKAEKLYRELLRERRYAELKSDDPRHGKTRLYITHGCRCGPCTKYETERKNRYRQKKRIKTK